MVKHTGTHETNYEIQFPADGSFKLRCYQCDKEVDWLNNKSRCVDCVNDNISRAQECGCANCKFALTYLQKSLKYK